MTLEKGNPSLCIRGARWREKGKKMEKGKESKENKGKERKGKKGKGGEVIFAGF